MGNGEKLEGTGLFFSILSVGLNALMPWRLNALISLTHVLATFLTYKAPRYQYQSDFSLSLMNHSLNLSLFFPPQIPST